MNIELLKKLDELAEQVYAESISLNTREGTDWDDHNEMVQGIIDGMIKAIEYYKENEHNNNTPASKVQ